MTTLSIFTLFVALRLFLLVSSSPAPEPVPAPAAAAAAGSSYWLASIERQGAVAYGDSSYKIFRNVMDYGAKGDGKQRPFRTFRVLRSNVSNDLVICL